VGTIETVSRGIESVADASSTSARIRFIANITRSTISVSSNEQALSSEPVLEAQEPDQFRSTLRTSAPCSPPVPRATMRSAPHRARTAHPTTEASPARKCVVHLVTPCHQLDRVKSNSVSVQYC
jgi:hypothetical protein